LESSLAAAGAAPPTAARAALAATWVFSLWYRSTYINKSKMSLWINFINIFF
jgi:hypothetical protein